MSADAFPGVRSPTAPPTPKQDNRASVAAQWTRGFLGAVKGLSAWLRAAGVRRDTIAVLSALDDHLLADLGIERGQIDRVAEAALRAAKDRSPAAPTAADRPGRSARGRVANDNRTSAEDPFEAVARQWRERGRGAFAAGDSG